MLSMPLQYYQNDTIHKIRQDTHCSGIRTSIPKIELWIGAAGTVLRTTAIKIDQSTDESSHP